MGKWIALFYEKGNVFYRLLKYIFIVIYFEMLNNPQSNDT